MSKSESLIFIGMDVHQDTVTLAVFEGASKEAAVVQKLPNDLRKLRRFFDRWAKRGEIRTCYEASGAGYVLYHELTEWRHACEIIAPSLTPIRSGEQKLLLSGVVLSQRRREHTEHYEQIVRHVRGFGAG